jgi:hypothetical protein
MELCANFPNAAGPLCYAGWRIVERFGFAPGDTIRIQPIFTTSRLVAGAGSPGSLRTIQGALKDFPAALP